VTVTGQLRNYWEVELNLHYTLIDWLVFNANSIQVYRGVTLYIDWLIGI